MSPDKIEVRQSLIGNTSRAALDADLDQPFHILHNHVYQKMRRMRPQKDPLFTPREARLFQWMVRDSQNLKNHYKEGGEIDLADEAHDLANQIAWACLHPEGAVEYQRFGGMKSMLEANLIGLMVVEPYKAFNVLESLAEQEARKEQKQVAESQVDVVDASLGPWVSEKIDESTPIPLALKKVAMARLLRPHLMQFEHVTNAADLQEELRYLSNRKFLSKVFMGKNDLPYPHISLGANRAIEFSLQNWGFERVRGYQWTEVVEAAAPTRVRRTRRATRTQ